jgi:Protein of unknown function (DUF1501)
MTLLQSDRPGNRQPFTTPSLIGSIMNDHHHAALQSSLSAVSSRRRFLSDVGMGFTGLALGAMLHRDGVVRADELTLASNAVGAAHIQPKAKSVIWIFLVGGMSQMESFDPKPALNKYAGMSIDETPFKSTLDSPYLKKNLREFVEGLHHPHPKLFPMQTGYQRYGASGIAISDWWPHLGGVIDDVAIVRSMWTTDNNHGFTPVDTRWKGNSRRLDRGCIMGLDH